MEIEFRAITVLLIVAILIAGFMNSTTLSEE